MNSYANLATIKDAGTLGITGTTYDVQLLRVAEESSRLIDKYCERFFYIYEGTFYQDGGATRVVLDWDVQSITANTTGLTVDTDGDGVYESAFNMTTTSPDAFLYPQNITPKTRLEANPWGDYGHFGAGIRNAIKIIGIFGYGNDFPEAYLHTASSSLGADLTSTATLASVSASTASEFSAGQTLRINSEQIYIKSSPTGSSCPIQRAINGTSAGSTASTATAISIYDYPAAIVQACIIQTIRSWKRRESAFVNAIINTDMGNIQVFKGLDPDIKQIINHYRRERIPRYI